MSKHNPKVSIGLVVYNGENYLTDAINALLAQTFTDFELIISDNGSDDRTPELCCHYSERDSRIRYFREDRNRGCAWNYNRVVELARGEYFMWAAHDDLWAPEFLEQLVEILDREPTVVRCFCRHSHVDAVGQPIDGARDIRFDVASGSIPGRNADTPHERLASILLSDSGEDIYALTRTSVLKSTGRYRPIYGSEKVLIAELSMRGQYHEVPETLYFSRVHREASGCIETAAGLQEYIDPDSRRRFAFIRTRLLLAHFQAIRCAPLGSREKTACFVQLARYLLQWPKWRRVLSSAITGAGNGGGYLKYLGDNASAPHPTRARYDTNPDQATPSKNPSPPTCAATARPENVQR